MEGLENILKVGEAEKTQGNTGGVNVFAQMIDDAEGLEKIENLQSHDNNEIYEKAVKILETYWLEEEDEQPAPGDAATQSGFNFGGGDLPVPSGGFKFGWKGKLNFSLNADFDLCIDSYCLSMCVRGLNLAWFFRFQV